MNTTGSECLENQNSTDCLLRALLNVLAEQKQAQDAGIDWDPITFGFTLLIGLVAAMIALATVFQAVLAGGKGGRRANSRAIGRWSKYTTRKWIFSEMSWSYTAYTPVLKLTWLGNQCDLTIISLKSRGENKRKGQELESAVLLPGFSSRREAGSLKVVISGAAPYPATWLGLFQMAGLENLDYFMLMPRTADYLPDDSIVVPASAEVGAIVAITAAIGVQRLDFDMDSYPVILGLGFQFDFRQHPILGITGAFSEHRLNDALPLHSPPPSPEKLAEAVMHSRGIIAWRPYPTKLMTYERDHGLSMRDVLRHSPPIYEGRACFRPDYNVLEHSQMFTATFILAKLPRFTPSLFPLSVSRGHRGDITHSQLLPSLGSFGRKSDCMSLKR